MTEMFCEFPLEIAHSLPRMPEGHKCRRVHGHSYRVRVTVAGAVNPESGMIFDYADLEAAWIHRVHSVLDHRNINEVLETDLTTSECVAEWIGRQLQYAIPSKVAVRSIELYETARFGARWTP
jgi:6-pyruvoyltetrahydropterin/6-carboxytetrahydropterin synthase